VARYSLKQMLEGQHTFQVLGAYLPDDHSRQMTAESMAFESWPQDARSVLDLGCGSGASIDTFKALALQRGHGIHWRGVDIAGSPEVRARVRQDGTFDTFDGVSLPYADASFDVVYSDQVFEHVRHPDQLVREVARVLKPGGRFMGTVSYLEPYHSYSIFNFTPYGLVCVLQDAGFHVDALRPCVDGLTMIWRQLLLRPRFFRYFINRVSPLNLLFSAVGKVFRLQPRLQNYLKVQVAGQICFLATRRAMDAVAG
jgi:SAM-dependent methyltransferase